MPAELLAISAGDRTTTGWLAIAGIVVAALLIWYLRSGTTSTDHLEPDASVQDLEPHDAHDDPGEQQDLDG